MMSGQQEQAGAAGSPPGGTIAPAPSTNGSGAGEGTASNNGGAPSATGSSVGGPAKLSDVQRAFLLGWSISELKGRFQVAAFDPSAAHNTPRGAPGAAAGLPGADAGLTTIQMTAEPSFWLASNCRAIFNRIALLHRALIVANATVHTWYVPGSRTPAYLFPDASNDYTSVGVNSPDAGPGTLQDFPLYDVTRRAVNCLTLLYLQPAFTLLPDLLSSQQRSLVQAVLGSSGAVVAPPVGPGSDPNRPAPAATAVAAGAEQDASAAASLPPADLKSAISALTQQALVFLEAWDGYLRENLYTGGFTAQDQTKLIGYEAGRTMASLSWDLSKLSVPIENGTVADPANVTAPTGAAPADPATLPATPVPTPGTDDCSARLAAIWKDAFDGHHIGLLQHQIAVLGKALDDDYFARTGGQPTDDGGLFSTPDPTLPSRALLAVNRTLDFWQHAVEWLTDGVDGPRTSLSPEFWRRLREALIEQNASWQALVVGQVDLRAYTPANVVQNMMHEIISAFEDVAGRQGLRAATAAVEQQLLGTIDDLRQSAQAHVKSLFGRMWWPAIAIVAVVAILGLVGLASWLQLLGNPPGAAEGSGISGLLVAILGAFGLFQARQRSERSSSELNGQFNQAKDQVATATASTGATSTAGATGPPAPGLTDRLASLFGQESQTVLQAFKDGYKRIQIDLADLGYAVAIAAPLVELLVVSRSIDMIKAEYDFLTKIIWNSADRKTEVMRVAYAAFGPIGLFALAEANKKETEPPTA